MKNVSFPGFLLYLTLILLLMILLVSLLLVKQSHGAGGEIIVYDEEGRVIKREVFKYKPMLNYTPKAKPRKTIIEEKYNAPAAPTGIYIEQTPAPVEKKRHKSKRSKIKKIEYQQGEDQTATVITREVRSATGKVYEEKEITIDARSKGKTSTQRYRERNNPPKSGRFIQRRRIR